MSYKKLKEASDSNTAGNPWRHLSLINDRYQLDLMVLDSHSVTTKLECTPETGHFRLGRFGRAEMSYNRGEK